MNNILFFLMWFYGVIPLWAGRVPSQMEPFHLRITHADAGSVGFTSQTSIHF